MYFEDPDYYESHQKDNIHYFIFLFKLEIYENYIYKLEELIENEVSTTERDVEERIALIPENKKEAIRSALYDIDHFHLKYSYPPLLRKSLFISIYSYLEIELNNICNEIKESKNLLLSVKDIKGNGIERAGTYLTKVVQIDTPFLTPLWKQVKSLNEIRNFFVHDNGDKVHSSQHKQLIASLKLFVPHIRLYEPNDGEYGIELEKEFCFIAIKTIKDFLKTVINSVLDAGIPLFKADADS